jgi:hypothetical protein
VANAEEARQQSNVIRKLANGREPLQDDSTAGNARVAKS